MIGTVKKWLGIEGVKLELILDEDAAIQPGMVSGLIRFTSMHSQVVTKVKVVLIEKYSRGRGKEKRVDEYELGNLELQEDISVIAGEEVDVEFTLKYKLVRSEMPNAFIASGREIFIVVGMPWRSLSSSSPSLYTQWQSPSNNAKN